VNEPTWLFVQFCWLAWLIYWVAMAFTAKRTVERGGVIGYRLVVIVLVAGLLAAGRVAHLSVSSQLWKTPLAVGIVMDCVVVVGAAFTVWARITLGRNWSAEVTLKQGHELIETGPYALVRHPIYTGLIAMLLATVIDYGHVIGFALLVGLCGGLWWKARQEEQVMSRHFPAAYAAYKARVRSIIPFVL
jgi:protein-S-isoprenylcysteine O-methyltransferase Ste14